MQQAVREQLITLARRTPWFMRSLKVTRSVFAAEHCGWCIGAGAVRNLVWDALHGYDAPSTLADIDVAYFGADDIAPDRDAQIEQRLRDAAPDLPWEVTNQAGVHLWFEQHFGHAVAPLRSLEDAVASWPEYATAVALTLTKDDHIDVIAPHGLDDLFAMVVRRNPQRVSVDTYRQRILQKQYPTRWPRVMIVRE